MSKLDVLVADDHDIVRRGLRDLLEKQPGWKVVAEATNGKEAVEKAKQLKPDVSILDVSMPSLDGLEAARQIVSERISNEGADSDHASFRSADSADAEGWRQRLRVEVRRGQRTGPGRGSAASEQDLLHFKSAAGFSGRSGEAGKTKRSKIRLCG